MTARTDKSQKHILVVEDSKMFTRLLKASIEADDHFKGVTVEDCDELIKLLESRKYTFFAGLLDLNLPDAPDGEVIDYVLS